MSYFLLPSSLLLNPSQSRVCKCWRIYTSVHGCPSGYMCVCVCVCLCMHTCDDGGMRRSALLQIMDKCKLMLEFIIIVNIQPLIQMVGDKTIIFAICMQEAFSGQSQTNLGNNYTKNHYRFTKDRSIWGNFLLFYSLFQSFQHLTTPIVAVTVSHEILL